MTSNIITRRRSTFKMNNKLILHIILFVNTINCDHLDSIISNRNLNQDLDTNKVLNLNREIDFDEILDLDQTSHNVLEANSDKCPLSAHEHHESVADFDSPKLLTNSSDGRLVRVKKQIYAPPYSSNGNGYPSYQNPQGQVSYVNPQSSYRQNFQGD